MADFDISMFQSAADALAALKEMAKNGDEWDRLQKYLGDVSRKFRQSTDETSRFRTELQSVVQDLKNTVEFLANTATASDTLQKYLQAGSNLLDNVKRKMGESATSTEAFAAKMALISPAFMKMTSMPSQFEDIGKAAKATQMQFTEIIDKNPAAFKALGAAFKAAFNYEGTVEDIRRFAQYTDATRNMEKGLLMSAAASGNLANMMRNLGAAADGSIDPKRLREGLEQAGMKYNQMTTTIANATGLSGEAAADFANKVMLIPNALKNVNDTTMIAGQQMSLITGAIRVAQGTAQDYDTVLKDLGFAFEELGMKGERSLEFITRMQQAADATGLPLDKMREFVKGTSQEFAMLGDNTDGVIDIIGRMGPALTRTGASTSQTMKIVKDMVDGLNGMTTGSKAFLSASTGGPGGLRGAFQIDQMLAEGKTTEVMEKLRKNMTSKLGSIVTREQAGQSDVAAAQYQKQLMFMQSPAMGGMAKDERSAARLLEAMRTGDNGKLAEGLGAATAEGKENMLRQAMEQGHKIQNVGNSWLESISNKVGELAGVQGLAANKVMQETTGVGSERFKTIDRQNQKIEASQFKSNPLTGTGENGKVNVNRYAQTLANSIKASPTNALSEFFTGAERPGMKPATSGADYGRPGGLVPPLSPGQRAAQTVARTEAQTNADAQSRTGQPATKQPMQKVDVAVTTVCSSCQRKVAAQEAQKVYDHVHENTQRQNYIGQ